MKKLIPLFIPCILFSCGSIYNEKNESMFSDMIWSKQERIIFGPFEVEDIKSNYDIEVTLSHFNNFGIDELPIKLRVQYPSMYDTTIVHKLTLKNSKGESLTECSGDYCDLTQTLETDYHFKEKGKYKIMITQPNELIKGITSLRLDVIKKD